MNILTNNFLAVHQYMSSVASNPKLNLTEAQKKTFQEVLTETTKELSMDYTKANPLSSQNSALWKGIGAMGMGSNGYSNLFMSGLFGNFDSNSYNPMYGLSQSSNASALSRNSSNYLSSFYKMPKAYSNSSNYDYSSIYDRLNAIKNNW